MTKIEYIKYAFKNKLVDKLKWYFTVLTIPSGVDNDFIVYDEGKFKVKINDELVEVTGTGDTLLTSKDVVTLTKDEISNIVNEIETTLGVAIVNYVLLANNFKDKIPYMNDNITLSKIENIITEKLSKDIITVQEYINFVDSTSFLANLSNIVVISATEKNILPPKGIDKFKKDLLAEMDKKYGKDWKEDFIKVNEYESKLKKFDDEYLKDDPTTGKLMSGKVKNVGRTKMFLTYGSETSFRDDGKANLIEESLIDGWPEDKEKLAALFNSARSGSYSRGQETALSGALSKTMLRATNSFRVTDVEDCGSKKGKHIVVTKINKNYLVDRYMLDGNKSVLLTADNIDKYLDKEIIIRSPMYCKIQGSKFCKKCAGVKLSNTPDGIPLLMTGIGGTLLNMMMKKMHGSELKTINVNIKEILK